MVKMLFWIWVILIGLAIVAWCFCKLFDEWDEYAFTWIIPTVVGVFGLVIATTFLVGGHVGVSGNVATNHARYDALVYQYENNVYENDNDLGKRELIVDIQKWNEDLARKKENQNDFWVGIFIPNVYDQFEFIEFEKGDNDA